MAKKDHKGRIVGNRQSLFLMCKTLQYNGSALIHEVHERRKVTFHFKKAESPRGQKLIKVSNLFELDVRNKTLKLVEQ